VRQAVLRWRGPGSSAERTIKRAACPKADGEAHRLHFLSRREKLACFLEAHGGKYRMQRVARLTVEERSEVRTLQPKCVCNRLRRERLGVPGPDECECRVYMVRLTGFRVRVPATLRSCDWCIAHSKKNVGHGRRDWRGVHQWERTAAGDRTFGVGGLWNL
jgi:hypothetical protein